jgi:Dolichyl-phosphate-mannose-protein mannosyltransferase
MPDRTSTPNDAKPARQLSTLLLLLICGGLFIFGVFQYPDFLKNPFSSVANACKGLKFFDLATIATHLYRLALIAALTFCAWALGHALLRRKTKRALLKIGVGLGLLSFALGLLCAAGLFSTLKSPLFPTVFVFAGVAGMLLFARDARNREPDDRLSLHHTLLWCLAPATLVVAVQLMMALIPPIEADELTYHLLMPKHYLQEGGFVEFPDIFHTYFPFEMEMLFSLMMGLADDITARLVHSLHWLLCGLLLFGIAREKSRSQVSAGMLTLVFLSLPVCMKSASAAYVGLSISFYTVLTVMLLDRFLRKEDWSAYYLAALCAGFALAAKWLGANVVLVVAASALWVLVTKARRDLSLFLPRLLLGGLIAIAPLAPMLIRNAIWTGNPMYPFADGLFQSNAWAEGAYQSFSIIQAKGYYGLHSLLFPWFGPGSLILLVLAIYGLVREKTARLYGLAALLYLILIVAQSPQDRFFLPFLALLVPAGACAISRIPRRLARAILLAVLGTTVLWNSYLAFLTHSDRLPVAVNQNLHGQLLQRRLPHFQALQWLNANHKPGQKYFLLGIPEVYYADVPFVYGYAYSPRVIDYPKIDSGEKFLQTLQVLGVTDVVLTTAILPTVKEFDQRLKSTLKLPNSAETFPGAVFGAISALSQSNLVEVYFTSSDKRVLAGRVAYPNVLDESTAGSELETLVDF